MRRSDLALVCDLGDAVRLPGRELQLLQAVLEALPPTLAGRTCVFLGLDRAEAPARRLLLPWVESFDARCRVLPLAGSDPERRAFDLVRGAALTEARAVLLLGGLAPAAVLRETWERQGGRRGAWSAMVTDPALLRLQAVGAAAGEVLQREAELERGALPLLDALWLPRAAGEGLRRLGVPLPAATGDFTPPCALADALLPWLAAAVPPAAGPAGAPALLCFASLDGGGAAAALLAALEAGLRDDLRLRRLTLVMPAGAAAAAELQEAAARLQATRGSAVEILGEADLAALAGRLAEPGTAAVVLPPPGTLRSEPLELCRRLGLPTLATALPTLQAQLAGEDFAPRWSAAEPEALAKALPPLLAAAGAAPAPEADALLRRPAVLPAGFGARLEALVAAGAEPLVRPSPLRRVAVAVRGAAEDPALQATLLSLREQSLRPAEVVLLEEPSPRGLALPRLLVPPPLPARRFAAADEAGWRAALAGVDADLLLLLQAGDLPAPWALERAAAEVDAATEGPAEALVLPVALHGGALLPDPLASFAADVTAVDEPLLLAPALLDRAEEVPRRRHPATDCRRSTTSSTPAPPKGAVGGEAAVIAAAPEQRLAIAARWLHDAEARPQLVAPRPAGRQPSRPPRPAGASFAGLLLGYTPRAGAALLLSALREHPRLGVAAAEAFAGVPGSRQLDHLALLRRRASGLRRRRVVLRGRLAHCADAEGLAAEVERRNLAVVVLQRQNRVRQAISQLNAERCRLRRGTEHPAVPPELPPLQLAPALLEERLVALAEGERRLEAVLAVLLARAPERVFLLTYEQLEEDFTAATAALLALLGLPPRALRPGLSRVTPLLLPQALAEPEALQELYRGSPLAAQLRGPAEGG